MRKVNARKVSGAETDLPIIRDATFYCDTYPVCKGQSRESAYNSGIGIFAARPILKGHTVALCVGSWQHGLIAGDHNVYDSVRGETLVSPLTKGLGWLINSNKDGKFNCRINTGRLNYLEVQAIKDISIGEELSVYYGPTFWTESESTRVIRLQHWPDRLYPVPDIWGRVDHMI